MLEQAFFIRWNSLKTKGCDHIAFDGKVLRGAKQNLESHPLQLMTAMVVENGLVIKQQETASKTNEIPIMQAMLSSMSIKGAVITADAMHCQAKTTAAIKEGQTVVEVQRTRTIKNKQQQETSYYITSLTQTLSTALPK